MLVSRENFWSATMQIYITVPVLYLSSVFRIRIRKDPGFYADPDPDFKNPDPDPSSTPMRFKLCFWFVFGGTWPKRTVLRVLNNNKKKKNSFRTFFLMDPDPDFRPIRIRTQAKKVRSGPRKKTRIWNTAYLERKCFVGLLDAPCSGWGTPGRATWPGCWWRTASRSSRSSRPGPARNPISSPSPIHNIDLLRLFLPFNRRVLRFFLFVPNLWNEYFVFQLITGSCF